MSHPNFMLFSSFTPYALANSRPELERLVTLDEETLQPAAFAPCGPTQPLSVGLAPPRGQEHGALIERIGEHAILKIMAEQRLLPASVIRDQVEVMAKQIEQESGRKVGSKRRRELRDEALLTLLPQSFTRVSSILVWIDPVRRLLVIGSTSGKATDAALTLLVKSMPGLEPTPLQTVESPSACMRAWLTDGVAPQGFGLGRDAVLKSHDASGASVRYAKHGLFGEDVQLHLREGKEVRQVELNWKDRLDFVLTHSLQIKRLRSSLATGDSLPVEQDDRNDPFDGDAALTTGELTEAIAALLYGLGGRVEQAIQEAA